MADDITLSSGNASGAPTGTIIATDTVATRAIQEVGIILGPHGTNAGRLEGNTELSALLASASRAATAESAAQSSPSHKGLLLFLDVTVSGGASDTLSLKLQAKDPISLNWADIYDFGVMITGVATGTKLAYLYPAADDTDFAGVKALKGSIPKTWRAVVTPNDATAWTYSLGAVGLP